MTDLMHPTVTKLRGAALAREVLSRIIAEVQRGGEQWDQQDWGTIPLARTHEDNDVVVNATTVANDCGTIACFAGHTVMAAGETLVIHQYNGDLILVGAKPHEAVSVKRRAAQLLELDSLQAWTLFKGSNNLKDLTAMVEMMERGEDIRNYKNLRR